MDVHKNEGTHEQTESRRSIKRTNDRIDERPLAWSTKRSLDDVITLIGATGGRTENFILKWKESKTEYLIKSIKSFRFLSEHKNMNRKKKNKMIKLIK